MRASRSLLRVLLGATLIVAVVVTALSAVRPTPTLGPEQSDTFTLGTAILVAGTPFDIQFRVIDAVTSAVVLESACYQYTVSQ